MAANPTDFGNVGGIIQDALHGVGQNGPATQVDMSNVFNAGLTGAEGRIPPLPMPAAPGPATPRQPGER